MVIFGQGGCIRAKVVLFKQKWLYLGNSGCTRAKLLYSVTSGCIRAKLIVNGRIVLFGQNWLYSGKSCIRVKWLIFGKSELIRAQMVVVGQKLL